MDILKNKYISFAGIIGSGKSTLARQFSLLTNSKLYLENDENPILKLFYKDMKKYSFLLETDLLYTRYAEQKEINLRKIQGKGSVQDRSIYEDFCFATMLYNAKLMSELEYNLYIKWYDEVILTTSPPDLIIWLDVSPKTALRRGKVRKRKIESGVSIEYLQGLEEEYKKLLPQLRKKIPIIEIKWDNDTNNIEDEAKKIAEKIVDIFKEGFYKKITI